MKYKRLIAVLLLWHLLLRICLPMPNLDGPWSLSHSFSIINGMPFKSVFAHDFFGFFNLPYTYGLINAVFYFPLAHTQLNFFSIFLVNLFFIGCTIFLIYKLFSEPYKGKETGGLISIALILSLITYLQRPELLNLVLLLLMQYVLSRDNFTARKKVWISGVLIGIIALNHAAGGIYAVYFFSLYVFFDQKSLKISQWIQTGLVSIMVCVLFYLPVLIIGFSGVRQNIFNQYFVSQSHSLNLSYLSKFLFYSIPFIPLFCLIFLSQPKHKIIRELILWCGAIAVTSLFGRYYYYHYLIHFLIYRFCATGSFSISKWFRVVLFFFFLAGAFMTLMLPTYQIIENPEYAKTYYRVLLSSREICQKNEDKKVWVSPYNAMSVIDQANARLYYDDYIRSAGVHPATSNDIFLFENPSLLRQIKEFESGKDSVIVENIIHPVKGLRRFNLNGLRTDSLGLWSARIVKR